MSLKTKARNTIQEICRICKEESKLFLFSAYILLIIIVIFALCEGIRCANKTAAAHWTKGLDLWCSAEYEKALTEWKTSLLISSFTGKEHARHLYWSAKAEAKAGSSAKSGKLLKRLAERYPCSYYALLAEKKVTPVSSLKKEYYKNRYPQMWLSEVRAASAETGVFEYTIWAIIKQESKFRRTALSRNGALGLMQLMPETASSKADKIGLKSYDLKNPGDNIKIGASYFSYLLSLSDENIIISLACYNAGRQAVRSWGRLKAKNWEEWIEQIPYPQTCSFVRNVLANNEMYCKIYCYDKNIPDTNETLAKKLSKLKFTEIHETEKQQGESR